MGRFLDLGQESERFNFPSDATSAHPSPPPTPPRMRTHRGHRHTQSLFVTPSRPNTGLQTPPNSRSKTYPTSNPYFLTTTPTRCKPTLAMSVHIHSPAPREPSPHHQRRAYSPRPASPTLRRNSSQQEHVPRPPSRSERLLRDTLMRDELERNNSYVPPLPSSPRRPSQSRLPSYESSGAGGCLTDDTDDAAADPWSTRGSFLFRTTANGSSAAAAAGLVRNRSMSHVRQQSISHPPPQGRCTSPTPSRHNLQRSANSMPTAIPLSSSTTTTTSSRSRSHSHSHSPSISSFPPAGASPHEAVLRSRLEKVLSMGREEQRLQHQQEGPAAGEVGIGSGLLLHRSQPHYQRTGKRRSGENSEWLWSSQDWTCSPSHSSTGSDSGSHHSPAPSSPLGYSTILPPSSPSPTHHHNPKSTSALAPIPKTKPNHPLLTPPDSPTFNARTASALCRQIEGYVSFANVEGLGAPEDEDDDEVCAAAGVDVGAGGVGVGGMKFGLGRLWKAWGREREVVVVQ